MKLRYLFNDNQNIDPFVLNTIVVVFFYKFE